MGEKGLYNKGEVMVMNDYEKECLQDAGCSKDFIEHMQCCQTQRQILLLRKHRCDFVEKIHDIQKKIDCVNDVLYRLKREGKCNE